MRRILERHDPILKQKAEPILDSDFNAIWLKELIGEMISIMKEQGAVGIAAPQIGVSKRVIVYGTSYTKRRKIEFLIPDTILINPSLTFMSEEKKSADEGCLNGDGFVGKVPRAIQIEYTGYDMSGEVIKKTATNLEARIIQHEIDHLDGILFFDRVEDKKSLRIYNESAQVESS